MARGLAVLTDGMKQRIGFVLATALALTFLAPWGSQSVPLPRRALEWLACAIIWEAAIWLVRRVALRAFASRGPKPAPSFRFHLLILGLAAIPAVPLSMLAVGMPVATLPGAALFTLNALGLGLILTAIRHGLRSQAAARQPGANPLPSAASAPACTGTADAARLHPVSAAHSLAEAALHTSGNNAAPAPVTATATGPVTALPPSAAPAGIQPRDFLRRHAPELENGTLLALAAEDHYLRIHTSRGQALALLRLRDAITSLGEEAGVQVHRSFWVARDAAPQPSRRGQSWQLDLPGGVSIPVSKARVTACRNMGWL